MRCGATPVSAYHRKLGTQLIKCSYKLRVCRPLFRERFFGYLLVLERDRYKDQRTNPHDVT